MANNPGEQKLDDLAAPIKDAQGPPGKPDSGDVASPTRASNSAYEFVGTILLCTFIGWLIDKYLHTKPWGILILLVIGFAAGMLNIWRTLNGYDQSVGLHKPDGK